MQSPLHFPPKSIRLWAIFCLVFAAAVVSCRKPCEDVGPANIDFLFKLYWQLTSKAPNDTILLSPVGILSNLVTISLGAQSQTQRQILETLQFNLTKLSHDQILRGFWCIQTALNAPGTLPHTKIGSALFTSPSALPPQTFTDRAAYTFGSKIVNMDFLDALKAENEINEYVKDLVFGRIKDASPKLNSHTSSVLVSTSFIEGLWDFPFDASQTAEMDFFVNDRKVIKVPFMYQKGQFLTYRDETVACTLVHKTTKEASGVYFILPDEGKMKQVEEAMSGNLLLRWYDVNVMSNEELYIPKFSLSTIYELEETLPDLGIKDLFTQQADLSGLSKQSGVSISRVQHKATLEMKEDGLIAAEFTSTMVSSGPVRPPPVPSTLSPPVHPEASKTTPHAPIRFNRPFLMGVFHQRSYTTLFWGKVINPALHGAPQGKA
ncbi:corticosteroid-binding globulin isoform X2 [Ornithorhynchus anatinus]|uniref:Serpin domain-containing protein n=2 Tax=Ornithorhynchus anatinus TaxID=9258 RepID=A0A6I8P0D1_ORNAN|nr:corticosteroid-binding globulin isoform X2 [Ornithorhynchus anatinus]